jgi:hypothetical protein
MIQVAATRYCDFQIQPADELVLKLDLNDYLVYTNKQLVTEKFCGKQHKTISIKEGTQITIDKDCQIKLEQHQIYGETSFIKTFGDPKIFTWNWDEITVDLNSCKPSKPCSMKPDKLSSRLRICSSISNSNNCRCRLMSWNQLNWNRSSTIL